MKFLKPSKKQVLTSSPVVLVAALATFIATHSPSDFEGTIASVQKAMVGQLVEINASEAAAYQWKIMPDNWNYKVINNGRTLLFSAVEPGDYLFICAMTKNDQVELVVHKVIILPYQPDISLLVKHWLPENYNKDDAHKLGQAFLLSAKTSTTIDELILKSSENNKEALGASLEAWKPFLVNVSTYCKRYAVSQSFEEHQNIWLQIAKELEAC